MRRFLLLAAFILGLSGCAGRDAVTPLNPRHTRIEWLGNECFRITSPIGTSILTNPYAPKTGGRSLPSNLKSDVVLITSETPQNNNVNALANQPAILRGGVGIGVNNVTGIRIIGVPLYLNPESPSSLGMNLVYAWTMDGIRYCFAMHPSSALDADQLAQVGRVDVLFMTPQGISATLRENFLTQLKPHLLIPAGSGAKGWTVGDKHAVQGGGLMLAREMLPAGIATLHF
jgi:hypothetical protein